ncbi:putative disease resistance RPP13-like protein 1 [Gastrolobium bilobum]|uniref:putative disease resistance RPP13-like protein 1 n=1 Tax=Gastrolobium bilobum TaxID=150636 RepID=UPI002AB241BE|nr:putative disease resistance RPP13-like protein 1 [Gastrolobium bilobum]XP_061361282.1 putative disease resistance RPP13-like protein 1 [Gastrolobium bilobum]XP_061361283.1 putative disease resistance RPP13-like protein 1 [Gastrolobium bilobum]XP_061361284.1 putative disease resistance RPP13-like protein 1 [Gastrolobium bilobum]
MAGALVGGAFLSGFINVVFDRLSSPEVANFIRGKKLDSKLIQRLETTLYAVQAVLNDAEHKQFYDPAVKKWLDDLKDAVYVADDLLDQISTEAVTQKEVSNFLSRFLNLRDRKVVSEIEDITSRLESIVKYKDILGLKEIPGENMSWRTPSTSLVKGNIYGRDNDQDAIIKILNDNSEENLSVIPIVGMGGVGKTTLAQWVFNDENLMKGFDLKAWVCVSEESDILNITRTVIEELTHGTCNVKNFNILQLDLKEKLARKKFFIVLDDVWNIDHHGWDSLKAPFQCGITGSKILVTTRSEKVASVVQTRPPYSLHELSDEHCWSVFAKKAHFPESNGDSTLEKIGREIVKRCKGLPLAAETLGGLLQTRHDIKNWNSILTSEIWEFPTQDSKIIPALRISYYHLPPHLKCCFAYCSLYPKDYRFDKDALILLWMAEDLLRRPKTGETLEEVGSECFDDLASRSFFKLIEQYFVMHDLIHDLAISVAGDFYFRSEELGKADNVKIQTRHLSYGRLSHPFPKNFVAIDKLKSLRTFLPINFSTPSFSYESAAFIILSMFKYLRVLSFSQFRELDALPDSIGELIHLRYLDLSYTGIKTLPGSLSNLHNLQTLKLRHCPQLIMLPSDMQNLVNLRHLDIRGTVLKDMPRGMSKLKHLQLLSDFVVGEHEENGIKELGELSNLHGSLWISKLENVTSIGEAREARIMDKTHIENLILEWSSDGDMVTMSTHIEREIFDKLQPHKNLKVLTIKRYRGTRFPDWVGHSSYHNMTHVRLESCSNCYMLPSLGQLPSLKSLVIEDFNGLEIIGGEFYKNDNDESCSATPFPSLETLSFYRMSSWEVWRSHECNAFPQLKELRISDCSSFRGDFPTHLPALETLEIYRCNQLVSSLPRSPAICELTIHESNKVGLQELPISLRSLSITGCELVESVFGAMAITQPTCLHSLRISDCPSALSFLGDILPQCLKELFIRNCEKVELPTQHELLETLIIENSCDSVVCFSLETFPNLKLLEIKKFEIMESLSVSQSQVNALSFLYIDQCPNLVSFPTEGFAAPNMTSFGLGHCNKLKSLPCHMNTLFPKLEYLRISNCPEIDSFPQGGLPPNLTSLEIWDCEKLLSGLSSMGMHQGLTHLDIACESVKSFPKEGLMPQLPSLNTLWLYKFENMETLNCKGLLHLTSLQTLTIEDCPKLQNMAGERLPPSLIKLEIFASPLLEERCNTKHPLIWPIISHILGIRVDGKWVS